MKVNWRERVYAAIIHFAITLVVAGLIGALIFFVWFPRSMAAMIGGADLFLLVLASDLVLGPLMSLVIYSSLKARRQLIIDYSVVGAVQLAALIYGVYVVSLSRPVFVAFDDNRLQIVTAIEIDDSRLAAAKEEQFRSLSWFGPKLVAVVRPTDAKELTELLYKVYVGGEVDVPFRPQYYREYDVVQQEILEKSLPLSVLLTNSGSAKSTIEASVGAIGKSADDMRWLLAHHRFGFGVAIIDAKTAMPIKYLAIDPAWVSNQYRLNRAR